MANDLRVPKQPVEIEVLLQGKEKRSVQVFLAEHQARAFRRQGVLDLLEHDQAFLPAKDLLEGVWCVFNKDTLIWAALSSLLTEPSPDEPDELFDHRKRVKVELVTGETLDGEFLYSAPAEQSRVADYLNNLPGRFFHLWATGCLYLVNRAYVLRVVECTPLAS